ncbi:MAG: DNA primase [Inquilinus sp.]|nr:DNA primase [Inquilinus sp.]
MPLPPGFLDELRARVPVSEVVGARVRLTRAGHEFKGLCPFHREKTPSFTVNDSKAFFHCFGCGAHGDAIGFLMQHDNQPFMEAVEQLAARAGLTVPQPTPEDEARFARQKGLHDLAEAACLFFEARLRDAGGRLALSYLTERGLDDETIARFRLGYAPAEGRALIGALKSEGFAVDAMVELGLARVPEDGREPYSFFRNRVMFPVSDRRGRVVAFGARLLEGDGPKYINSPDHPLFHKGQLLYGMSRARMAAGQGHSVVVAEGYMDVIALVAAGFQAAVAPLGTALTEAQIQELWKLSAVPVLCFDGDTAGLRAASRAADRALPLLRPDQSVRIAYLPTGEDPDSLIAAGGAKAMRAVLESARPLAEILWERALTAHRTDTPEGRAGLKAALEAEAALIVDRTVQEFYRREFRQRVEAAFPWRTPAAQRPRPDAADRPAARSGPRPRRPAEADPLPTVLLAALLGHPALFDEIGEAAALLEIADGGLDRLRREMIAALSGPSALDSDSLRRHLCESGCAGGVDRLSSDRIYTLAPFARPTVSIDEARAGWHEVWRRLEARRTRDELRAAGSALGREPSEANLARVQALQAERSGGEGDEPGSL